MDNSEFEFNDTAYESDNESQHSGYEGHELQNEMMENDNSATGGSRLIFKQDNIWKSSSRQTAEDTRATELLLHFRAGTYYKTRFDNKSTKNINLWIEIAKELAKHGVPITADDKGGRKCRKKFNNLTSAYLKFTTLRNETGNITVVNKIYYFYFIGNMHIKSIIHYI